MVLGSAEMASAMGKKKVKNAKKIPVLTYHRIYSDEVKNSPANIDDRYSVSLSTFDQQMKWLSERGYRAVTCDEFYKWRKGKLKLPKRSVLITIDDGHAGSIENAAEVFRKYGLKGTAFIKGRASHESDGSYFITYSRICQMKETCPEIEFQSHTYDLHELRTYKTTKYNVFKKDADHQKSIYHFKYLAYPHGWHSATMIKAYKKSGIKMAFLFGKPGYATRKQNLYKMKRIEVRSSMTMDQFRKWCN